MNADPLDRVVTRATLQALYSHGHLSAEARDAAVLIVRPHLAWWRWAGRLLLLLGAALLLAGIVFFFAYNWSAMTKFTRFALIEAAILGGALGSRFAGPDRLGGRVLLLAASLMVGVFLAVFGQVYQTGADAFELFQGWALLIAGWVLVSRFAALWVMWLVIVNTWVLLYWGQVGRHLAGDGWDSVLLLMLGAFNGTFLGLREWGMLRGVDWVRGEWVRVVLLAAMLGYLQQPVLASIFDPDERGLLWIPSVFSWGAALGVGYYLYRHRFQDLFALTLTAFSFCIVVLSLIGRVLFEAADGAGTFLLFGLLVLGVCGAVALWLRELGHRMKGVHHG